MARRVHYELLGFNDVLSKDQLSAISSITTRYKNTFEWTREVIQPFGLIMEPNMDNPMFAGARKDMARAMLLQMISAMRVSGGSRESAHEYIVEKNLASKGARYYTFTDVGDNEFNASLVVQYCNEISIAVPEFNVAITDEGDQLYCPIIIQQGRAVPWKERTLSILVYWEKSPGFNELDQNYMNAAKKFYLQASQYSKSKETAFFQRDIKQSAYLFDKKDRLTIELRPSPEDSIKVIMDSLYEKMSQRLETSKKYYKDLTYYPELE